MSLILRSESMTVPIMVSFSSPQCSLRHQIRVTSGWNCYCVLRKAGNDVWNKLPKYWRLTQFLWSTA